MLAAILLLFSAAAPPQAVESPPASVYRVRVAVDAPAIAVATLGALLPYVFASDLIHPRCPCDPSEVNALDRHVIGNHNKLLDDASDATAAVAVAAPLLLDAVDLGLSEPFLEDAAVYAETLAVNGALVSFAKYTVQRPLPRTYEGDPGLVSRPGGYRSFYSGHTSLTVAALAASAMTLRLRRGEKVWPWIVAGLVGAMVSAERVAAGRHFYTDVAVGFVA
ncbi:MAG TPA: phosphatase PAP2 family protein, partial [Thermoanaerobaculia bacterium]